MIVLTTEVRLSGAPASAIYRFLLDADDASYQRWWPGTHLQWHTVAGPHATLGSTVRCDEWVGRRRLRFDAVITSLVENARIVWRMKRGVRLPAWLTIDLRPEGQDVVLTHSLRVGFAGVGRLLDPLFRVALGRRFDVELDEHARTEFPMLAKLLAEGAR